jgi:hypothetical protein
MKGGIMVSEKLPAWLAEVLPKPRASYVIGKNSEGAYTLTGPRGGVKTFATPAEAYDDVPKGKPKRFDPSFHDGVFWFETLEGQDTARILMAFTDEEHIEGLEEEYEAFRKAAKRYRKDPQDFLKAFTFLNRHPAFWIFTPLADDKHSYTWGTDGAVSRFHFLAFKRKGRLTLSFELGEHVKTDSYRSTYFDPELIVHAKTYEKLVLKLARKVDNTFRLDGSRRDENVEPTAS